MLGFTIKRTNEIAAMTAAIKNAEAKAQAQEKKTKTTAIIGGSTTGVAVAAAAVAHFVFGQGRKLNREAINNYAAVVEERDAAINERNEAASKVEGLNNKVKALENTVETVTASGYNLIEANGKLIDEGDLNAWNKAVEAHENITAKVFGTRTPEDLDKLRANLRKSFETTLKELEKADQTPAAPAATTNTATAEADLKTAQDAFNTACKKAGDARNALEAAKAADPNGDHSALQAAFEAANKELEDADKALKALQNNG